MSDLPIAVFHGELEAIYGPADFLAESALTGGPNGGASNTSGRPILRQGHRLRAFGNKVLRRLFEHKQRN
jgi:hypothetical protein